MGGRPVYFPTPNSVPKSSAAPTVTTRVPTAGPRSQDGAVADEVGELDSLTDEDAAVARFVHPAAAEGIEQDRRLGHDQAGLARSQGHADAHPLPWAQRPVGVGQAVEQIDPGGQGIGRGRRRHGLRRNPAACPTVSRGARLRPGRAGRWCRGRRRTPARAATAHQSSPGRRAARRRSPSGRGWRAGCAARRRAAPPVESPRTRSPRGRRARGDRARP